MMAPDVPLRRRPQQLRGQRRIEAILDAAERLFAELGYEATSTNQIAAEADTSIGSLYQFFPNKEAILRALVARSQEQMREVLDAVFSSDPHDELTPDELLDRLLDPLIALYARGYRMLALFVALPRMGDGAQAGAPLVEEIVWRLDTRLARRMPGLSSGRRELSVRMIVETVRALMPLMTTAEGQVRPEAVTELKRMLRAYIAAGTAAYQHRTGQTGPVG
ncbi:MAG TPA: TetR/AcrR family transcriptional regulator [Ktedonobacterales bacterium]|nr:TetR/AcrR family transcriptional regulator [Ktedonobacterales bacterium]